MSWATSKKIFRWGYRPDYRPTTGAAAPGDPAIPENKSPSDVGVLRRLERLVRFRNATFYLLRATPDELACYSREFDLNRRFLRGVLFGLPAVPGVMTCPEM